MWADSIHSISFHSIPFLPVPCPFFIQPVLFIPDHSAAAAANDACTTACPSGAAPRSSPPAPGPPIVSPLAQCRRAASAASLPVPKGQLSSLLSIDAACAAVNHHLLKPQGGGSRRPRDDPGRRPARADLLAQAAAQRLVARTNGIWRSIPTASRGQAVSATRGAFTGARKARPADPALAADAVPRRDRRQRPSTWAQLLRAAARERWVKANFQGRRAKRWRWTSPPSSRPPHRTCRQFDRARRLPATTLYYRLNGLVVRACARAARAQRFQNRW